MKRAFKALRKRSTAAVIMAAIILISLFGGTYRSVSRLSRDVEKTYYSFDDGYGDISEYIETCRYCAEQLSGIASEALGKSDEEVSELQSILKEIKKKASPADIYLCVKKIAFASEDIISRIKEGDYLGAAELDKAERLALEISSNASRVENVSVIRRDVFNNAASDFNEKVAGRLPSSIFCWIFGIDKFELIY